jgi:sugar phosphate isomerase/epimerase
MATVALERDGSATVQHPLERVLAAAAGAGFRGVALDWFSLRAAERAGVALDDVAARARDLGLVFTDLSALGLGSDDSADERVSASMARRCAALGIPVCAFVLNVPPAYDRVSRVADVFAASGVRLALEFVPYTTVRTLGEAREVCQRVGSDRVGLLVDTWHLARSGGSAADLADLRPGEIACVQVADAAPVPADDLAEESRRARLLPGEGVVDFGAVAAALSAVGYDGPLGTEVLARDLAARPPEEVAEACFRAASSYFPAGTETGSMAAMPGTRSRPSSSR